MALPRAGCPCCVGSWQGRAQGKGTLGTGKQGLPAFPLAEPQGFFGLPEQSGIKSVLTSPQGSNGALFPICKRGQPSVCRTSQHRPSELRKLPGVKPLVSCWPETTWFAPFPPGLHQDLPGEMRGAGAGGSSQGQGSWGSIVVPRQKPPPVQLTWPNVRMAPALPFLPHPGGRGSPATLNQLPKAY